jgi:hypothetical protein
MVFSGSPVVKLGMSKRVMTKNKIYFFMLILLIKGFLCTYQKIPLNPPLQKGDLKVGPLSSRGVFCRGGIYPNSSGF